MNFEAKLIDFVRSHYGSNDFIPLHAPIFNGKERVYVNETLDSTFVSSVGKYVDEFESKVSAFTGAAAAIATVNGTAALNTAMYLAGVVPGDFVITQALTFVATCNALKHMGADPIFVDVDIDSMGLSPEALENYLDEFAYIDDSAVCRHRASGRRIKAVVPMHTFGHPVRLDELVDICNRWNVILIEDAAESLGSFYKGKHTGTISQFAALSFNGNKIITTGGGGMVLCTNLDDGLRAKHLTTTAKVPHKWEFFHDEAGFNFRLPNLNAALGCAQIEQLPDYLLSKRKLAMQYKELFCHSEYEFILEPAYARSNYWLNAVICEDQKARNNLLETTNNAGVMTRPVWTLMHRLPMYQAAERGKLSNSEWLEARVVNIPSSPLPNTIK